MKKQDSYYGSTIVSNFLPTLPALRYLNCCRMAGWHCCNQSYHMQYNTGYPFVFTLFTLNGNGWIKTRNKHYELSAGDILIIPADTPMEYGTSVKRNNISWEFYWLNMDGSYVRQTAAKLWEDNHVVHNCSNADEFSRIFQWFLETSLTEENREFEHSLKIQDLFQKLISQILFQKNTHSLASGNVSERILEYVQINHTQKLTLEELSRHFFLSKNHIIRIFRKRTGYTPYEYIIRYRLIKAAELLYKTTLSVNEISDLTGYCSNSHFTAQFHEFYGMTPTEYREMMLP